MSLEGLCRSRIKKDFNLDVDILDLRVLEPNDIDRRLNLTAVEATFLDKDGCPGQAAITLEAREIKGITMAPLAPILNAGAQLRVF